MSDREREQTTIRIPEELKKELQQDADELGISFNAYVNTIIREHLENRK